jgi:hypothetical protein
MMVELPSRQQQIIHTHAGLINAVVRALHNRALLPELEAALEVTRRNGWGALVAAIHGILAGQRDASLLADLDEEDTTIVEAILRGIQDPETLPDPNAAPDPTLAAPGLAHMIHGAGKGDVQALQLLGNMAEQMTRVGGDMARLGAIMKRLVDGERDAEPLCRGMGAQGESLVVTILEELGRLEAH